MGDARHTLTSRRRTRGALLGAMNPPRDRTAVRPTSTFAGTEHCRHGPFPSAVRTWRGRAPRSAVLRCDHEGDARRSGASFCAQADALDRRLCMVAPSRRLPSCLAPVIILGALRPCRSEYLLANVAAPRAALTLRGRPKSSGRSIEMVQTVCSLVGWR